MEINKLTKEHYREAAITYLSHYGEVKEEEIKKTFYYMGLEGIHLIALENGKIIGMLVAPYSNMNPNIVEISYIAVKEKRKGVGKELMNELIRIAMEQNKRSIITYSRSAVEFYKKQGFKEISEDSGGKIVFMRLQ